MNNNINIIIKKALKPLLPLKLFVIFSSTSCTLIGLIQPYILGKILDSFTKSSTIALNYILISVFIILMSFLLNWLQNYFWFKMIYKGIFLSRTEVFSLLLKNNIHFFEKCSKGDVLNRVMNDVAQYSQSILLTFPMLLLNIFTLVVIMFFLFYMNYMMAFLIIFICIIYFIYYKFLNNKLQISMKDERKSYSNIMSSADEALEGIRTIQVFNSEKYFANRFLNTADNHYRFILRLQKWKSVGQSGTAFLKEIMPLAVVFLGVYLTLNGYASIGIIFSFVTYLQYLHEPIGNLTDLNLMFQQRRSTEERIQELIPEYEETLEHCPVISTINQVRFEKVCFSYDDKKHILSDFSLTIKKGDLIAVTGSSGIGKSTLIKLLLRYISPDTGKIYVNETELNDLDITSYKERLAVLPQDIFLFDASINENIKFGHEISKQKIDKAVHLSYLDNNQNDKILSFSGGERQRTGIARIFAKDVDIIILDEPTSALDIETEVLIIENIKQFLAECNATLIVISHRKEIINICNMSIKIIGDGNYEIEHLIK